MVKNQQNYIQPLNDLINTVKSIQMEYKVGPEYNFEQNSVMIDADETAILA
jgi:hypothetical protein